jgi:hypothetical protein
MKPTQRKHSIADEFKHVKIYDYRIVRRLKHTAELLEKSPESSIPKAYLINIQFIPFFLKDVGNARISLREHSPYILSILKNLNQELLNI